MKTRKEFITESEINELFYEMYKFEVFDVYLKENFEYRLDSIPKLEGKTEALLSVMKKSLFESELNFKQRKKVLLLTLLTGNNYIDFIYTPDNPDACMVEGYVISGTRPQDIFTTEYVKMNLNLVFRKIDRFKKLLSDYDVLQIKTHFFSKGIPEFKINIWGTRISIEVFPNFDYKYIHLF